MVCLFAGLWAVHRILWPRFLNRQASVFGILILSLLSFVIIMHSTIPLTDICFFGIAMCTLAVMESAAAQLTLWKLALSFVLVALSISVRRIGIALIPPLLWIVLVRPEVQKRLSGLSRRGIAAALALAAVLAGALAWVVYSTSTLRDFRDGLGGHALADALWSIATCHLKELGEVGLNIAAGELAPTMQRLLPWYGAVVLLLMLGAVAARRKQFGPVDVFFLCYTAIVFAWSYYDPRFWLPLIPLVFAYVGLSVRWLARWWIFRPLLVACLLVFTVFGAVTLAHSTEASLAGPRFGDAYPDYHATYCAAGYCAGSDQGAVDRDALRVLRDFR
jgi:hypothetical protein